MNECDKHDIEINLDKIKTIAELLYATADGKKLSAEAARGIGKILQEACVEIDAVVFDLEITEVSEEK